MPLGFQPMPFGYSLRGHTERRKDQWFGNPKGIVSSSPGLPSPRGYPGLASVRFSTPTGLADTTRFSQGSSRLATLGFGAESLWDSLEFPKGIGSIPSGIGLLSICRHNALSRYSTLSRQRATCLTRRLVPAWPHGRGWSQRPALQLASDAKRR